MRNSTLRLLCGLLLTLSALSAKAADHLFIIGDAVWGGWFADNAVMMNAQDNGVFQVTVYLDADKEFKFMTVPQFDNEEYRAAANGTVLTPGTSATLVKAQGKDNDNKFKVSEAANYTITCNLTKNTVLVEKAAYQTNRIDHPNLWLVGDATPGGWTLNDGVQMTQDASNPLKFTVTTALSKGDFKIATNSQSGFGQTMYKRDASDNGKMVFGGDDDNKWTITEQGIYTISVDLSALTISIVKDAALIDENSSDNAVSVSNGKVVVKRTFNADAWNTLVLPFALTASQIESAFGADVKVATYKDATQNTDGTYTLNFTTLTDKAIQTGVPVIVYGAQAADSYTFEGVTTAEAPAATGEVFQFVGFAGQTTAQSGDWYVSSDNKFYKANGSEEIKATRAVFRPVSNEAGGAKGMTFVFNQSTAISGIHVAEGADAPVYNLAGQRVSKGYRGIVIKNGKKFINQ